MAESHKYKVALARRMMTRQEIRGRKSIFDSAWWAARRDKRSDRQLEQMDMAELRREQKRADNLKRHQEMLDSHKVK